MGEELGQRWAGAMYRQEVREFRVKIRFPFARGAAKEMETIFIRVGTGRALWRVRRIVFMESAVER
jgi:hypothetical protein